MATQDLEKLVVQLTADFKSYEREMAKAQGVTARELRKIEKQAESSLTRIQGSMKKFGAGLLTGFGIASMSQIGDMIKDLVSQAAKIGDISDRIGISTDALQGLQQGAVQADISFEELSKTLFKFSKTIGQAETGQGDYLKTLRASGQEIQGTFLGNLRQLADLVANAADKQQALLIVQQAMGKGAEGWLEVFEKGSAGIDQMIASTQGLKEESIRTAQVLDDKLAKSLFNIGIQAREAVLEALTWFQKLDANVPTPAEMGQRAGKSVRAAILQALGFPPDKEPVIKVEVSPEITKPAPGAGTVKPTTVVFDPEKDAAARKKAADATREQKKALDELNREREREQELLARERASFFDDLAAVRERTEALVFEAGLLGKTTAETEKARAAQELLNSAREHGQEITPGVAEAIDQLATSYGDAAAMAEQLAYRTDVLNDLNSTFQSAIEDIFMSLAEGVDPVEALTNALKDLAKQLTQIALNRFLTQLISGGGPGGTGKGLFGSLFGTAQHQGGEVGRSGSKRLVSAAAFIGAPRMHSGGIAGDEQATILQKGELVLPRGFRGGGGGGITIIDQRRGGEPIKAQNDPRGGKMLFIRDAVRAEMSQFLGGDQGAKLMNAKYGVTPRVISR